MKKIISILLALCMMSTLICFATEGNIDGTGGDMSSAGDGDGWNTGNEGVRVTVIKISDQTQATTPVDFSNIDFGNNELKIDVSFKKVSKFQYQKGVKLSVQVDNYIAYKPDTEIPQIITSDGSSNIEAIKDYFEDEKIIRQTSDITGFNYDTLTNGDYKLLIEPIAYYRYGGYRYAMTATEAALFGVINSDLSSRMGKLTHQNLPLSMFPQEEDLELAVPKPPSSAITVEKHTEQEIIDYLGLGIISFSSTESEVEPDTEEPDSTETPSVSTPNNSDVTYNSSTYVVTSVLVSSNGTEYNASSPAYVDFNINGTVYRHNNIYIPENSNQLAWVRWETPENSERIEIYISSNATISEDLIIADVVELEEQTPPDPQADDRNDSFVLSNIIEKTDILKMVWGEWDSWYNSRWKQVSRGHYTSCPDGCTTDHKEWIGRYEFEWMEYTTSITANMDIEPDEKVPTAIIPTFGTPEMKSGYGFNVEVTSTVQTSGVKTTYDGNIESVSVPTSSYTGLQNVITYFPEFNYETYNRILQKNSNLYSPTFEFKVNKYSTFGQNVHFTPVWFPDTTYTLYANGIDAYTPAGKMSVNLQDDIKIQGSLFDDWRVVAAEVE